VKVSQILNDLKLGNSVAESDERLDRYFVNTQTFNALITGQRDIIAGDKGTGKTALYRILIKRYRHLEELRATEVVTAFNLTGSPIFQQLLHIPQQTEGLYIAFWKTYFLALVGNWLIDQPKIVQQASIKRVQYFLQQTGLKTIDTSPKGIVSKLIGLFPRTPIKAVEVELGVNEVGMPHATPRAEFGDAPGVQPLLFFGIDYPAGLKLLEASLRESNLTIWIALDRLDEAFQGYHNVEIPALRALLRTYLDFNEISNIRLKLFLRKDLFRKVIAGGFVNLTHINDKKIEIVWDDNDLKYLLINRIRDSEPLVQSLNLDSRDTDAAFAAIFPDKVAQGEKQATTWNWMLSRIRDGNDVIAPRNLIDLVEKAREVQMRVEYRSPREYIVDSPLIEPDSIRAAHKLLSQTRVEDTLLAESPHLVPLLEKFRNQKAEYDLYTLKKLFGVDDVETAASIKKLREIGFLKEAGSSYKVPMLYRDGFNITQGRANGTHYEEVEDE